ncbi:MAG: branched-chain amino acid ABC transporter permease [Xanthobacteraceae bacterium]|nr:MAG: branched-chain amino acid ABC transporter permease [Xanthobacteraceae bacterium]
MTEPTTASHWTWHGMRAGARAMTPLLPGIVAFSLAFGTVAAQKGLSFGESLVMTATVYAGLSQFVALQTWPDHFTLGEIAALAAVTMTINLRFVLMGASLRPWLGAIPPWQSYPSLALMTDGSWLLALRYRAEGGHDAGFYYGMALLNYVVWVIAVIPGYFLASSLSDPKTFGIDMIMVAFFAAMLVTVWRGYRRALAWLVAGCVAVAVNWLFSGWWFIVAGAVAGSVAGGFIDDAD